MSGTFIPVNRESVQASLHALSQPLTVISLALTIAMGSADETERAQALETVSAECQRAMRSVHQLRILLEDSARCVGAIDARDLGQGTQSNWTFGGMA